MKIQFLPPYRDAIYGLCWLNRGIKFKRKNNTGVIWSNRRIIERRNWHISWNNLFSYEDYTFTYPHPYQWFFRFKNDRETLWIEILGFSFVFYKPIFYTAKIKSNGRICQFRYFDKNDMWTNYTDLSTGNFYTNELEYKNSDLEFISKKPNRKFK